MRKTALRFMKTKLTSSFERTSFVPFLKHSDFDETAEAAHIYDFFLPGSRKTVCKENW